MKDAIKDALKNLKFLILPLLAVSALSACTAIIGSTGSEAVATALNHAPVASSQSDLSVNNDATLAITLSASDEDDDTLNYSVIAEPSHGVLSGSAPDLVYTPTANYSGPDSFTFKANDGKEDSEVASISISVLQANRAPVAAAQSGLSVNFDATLSITLSGTDADSDSLTYTIVNAPLHGTLSGTAPALTYTPGSNYLGTDSFTFKVNDGTVDSSAVAVDLSVRGVEIIKSFSASPSAASTSGELLASGGVLYGMTWGGGASDRGAIFSVNPDGTNFTILHSFAGGNSASPYGNLIISEGVLYGVTAGEYPSFGTIFSINPDGSDFNTLHTFSGSDGASPSDSLLLLGGVLYGMTSRGGDDDLGTIFSFNPVDTSFTTLHSFSGGIDGATPYGSLIVSDGVLYGMNLGQVNDALGTIFSLNPAGPDGPEFNVLYSFTAGADGGFPTGNLLLSGGVLYGVNRGGGSGASGTIFSLNPDGSGFTTLHSFGVGTDGAYAYGELIISGGVLYGMTNGGGSSGFGTIFSLNPDGSGYSTLHSFSGGAADGKYPEGSLIVSEGVIYGMAYQGGENDLGVIFKFAP